MKYRLQIIPLLLFLVFAQPLKAQNLVTGAAYAVAWSPDGSKIAVGGGLDYCDPNSTLPSGEFAVLILNAETSDLIRRLEGASCKVTQVLWSPDGRKIAAISEDNVGLHIWDTATGKSQPVDHYENVKQEFYSLSWKPDSTQLATAFYLDGDVSGSAAVIFDPTTGGKIPSQSPTISPTIALGKSVAWSPDGNTVMVGVPYDGIQLMNAATGETRVKVYPGSDNARFLAWSPDSKQFASAGDDQRIRIWDAASGNLLQTIPTDQAIITDIAWSPKGGWVASSGRNKTVKVWDVDSGQAISIYQSPQPIYDLDWNRTGDKLIYTGVSFQPEEGNGYGTYAIVDVPQNTGTGQTLVIAWKPDGKQIAIGLAPNSCGDSNIGEAGVRIIDSTTHQLIQRIPNESCFISSLDWSADGKQLAANDDNRSYVWNMENNQIIYHHFHAGYTDKVSLDPSGTQLATSYSVSTILSGQTQFFQGGLIADWNNSGSEILSQLYRCGAESGGTDCSDQIQVTDAHSGMPIKIIDLTKGQYVGDTIWNSDGSQFASAITTLSPNETHSVQIWDADTYQIVNSFSVSSNWVEELSWSPDDHIIATVHRDEGEVRLWNTQSEKQMKVLKFPGSVYTAAWSPDGSQVAYGGSPDSAVKVDLADGCETLLDNTMILCDVNRLELK